jgi:hypothetical protein
MVAARHLNILGTARLGLGYHALLTNMTKDGSFLRLSSLFRSALTPIYLQAQGQPPSH